MGVPDVPDRKLEPTLGVRAHSRKGSGISAAQSLGCLDSVNSGIVERWNGGMDFFLSHFVCLLAIYYQEYIMLKQRSVQSLHIISK